VVGTAQDATVAEPAGAQPGDLLVALSLCAAAGTLTQPAGWTPVFSGTSAPGAFFKYNVSTIVRGAAAPSLTWTTGSSVYREVFVAAVLGSTTVEQSAQIASASLDRIDPPSVTTAAADSLALAGGAHWTGSAAWVAPASYTKRSDNAATYSGVLISRALIAAGAEDPGNLTPVLGFNDAWAFSLMLT
jgi:hypothetical protein